MVSSLLDRFFYTTSRYSTARCLQLLRMTRPMPVMRKVLLPSLLYANSTWGTAMAQGAMTRCTWAASVGFVRRNLSLAGWLPKRFSTVMLVPMAVPVGHGWSSGSPYLMRWSMAASEVQVTQVKMETAAIEGRASPRKPRVSMFRKSSAVRSFEVACRANAGHDLLGWDAGAVVLYPDGSGAALLDGHRDLGGAGVSWRFRRVPCRRRRGVRRPRRRRGARRR